MSKDKAVSAFIRDHKTLFIVIGVVIFLIEIEIFAVAVTKSGRKSWLQVRNAKGNVIYETPGEHLSHFNKYYFEKTFGPFDQYDVKLVSKVTPFPFRAWFTAAVGIPVGAVLLIAFIFRATVSLLHGDSRSAGDMHMPDDGHTRFEKTLARIARFNIFTIGFLVFAAIFLYWVIPNVIAYAGKIGIETITRYKWIFLSLGILFVALVVWIIYLRYLLAKKSIESQTEIKKYQLQIEAGTAPAAPLQLDYDERPEPVRQAAADPHIDSAPPAAQRDERAA